MSSTNGGIATGSTRARDRTRLGRRGFAIALSVLVLLIPMALATLTPRFAASPRTSVWSPPPIPAPGRDARQTLDGIVDSLPIVARDLPDEASRRGVEEWDAASFSDPRGALAMLEYAWGGLQYNEDGAEALQAYLDYLVFGSSGRGPRELSAAEPSPEATAALASLSHDPRNADRLNNVAVALFALGAGNDALYLDEVANGLGAGGERVDTINGYELDVLQGGLHQVHAIELLAAVEHAFGPHRAARLNAAYFLGAIPDVNALTTAIPFADRQLASDPRDRTARVLLASIQSRRIDVTDGLHRALTILAPLAGDPAAGPFADVARGDVYLAAASVHPEAPFQARHLAMEALAAYDRALATTSDPGVYAGRAAALALLGAFPEAVEAQEAAVNGSPNSLPLLIELATLREAAHDFPGMQEAARQALRLVEKGWAPPLNSVRFVPSPATPISSIYIPGDRGYLGYSYGSDRDRASVFRGTQGGAFVVSLDLIPRTNAGHIDDWRRTATAPTVALQLAQSAAVLLGDLRPVGPGLSPVPAALLAAGEPFPANADAGEALLEAENALRQAGQFAQAADLCRRALADPPGPGFDRIPALTCAGESTYLAAFATGSPRPAELQRASADLDAAYEEALRIIASPVDEGQELGLLPEVLRLRALQAAQAAGRPDRARYLAVTAGADLSGNALDVITATAKLGELELETGDAAAAEQTYDLALLMLKEPGNRIWTFGFPELLPVARTLEQRSYANRGVARLRQAQDQAGETPDCTAHQALCAGARADFTAALARDPRNPVALLNAAWAVRLLGERESARDYLALAAEVDPTLFPALNDLGVLAAEDGDTAAADTAFRGALAAAPGYDLAAWNLGVLELRRGISGIPSGQAWLLRAIAANPSFRGHDLAFKTDERIYRVTFGPDAHLGHGWSFGRAYSGAAVALGAISVLAAAGAALNSVLSGKLSDTLTDLGRGRLERASAMLGSQPRRLFVRAFGRWWVSWEPWLLTIPVLVVATAWPAWQADPATGAAAAVMAVFAAAVAVAAHEAGHALAAEIAGAQLAPAQWAAGPVLALLLLPLRLSSGPFIGHRVVGVGTARAWWVYLGGPIGNMAVAAIAYGLFLAHPLPLLRLLTEVQLAAIGYALLPFTPLDGSVLGRRPGVVAALGLFLGVVGVLFTLGML